MSDGAVGSEKKRVLILTYAFPPVAYVGVFRTLKYCKYLGRHGWDALVLTAKPGEGALVDEALAAQLPVNVRVHQTADCDPAKWLSRRGRSRVPAPQSSNSAQSAHAPRAATLWQRFKKAVNSLLTNSPDSHIFWNPFALLAGARILMKERVDLIYSTSPPHSSHIAAFLLAKWFRKPYVLDFRDPWYVNGSVRVPDGKPAWVLKLETLAKRRAIRGSARVICATRGECEELRAEYPGIAPERFTFITNGYDPADFELPNPVAHATGRLTIVHTGTIYPGIAGEYFQALRVLFRDHLAIARQLRVQLLGEVADEYADTVHELEQTGLVERLGFLPHREALRITFAGDVLLVLLGGTKFLPSHLPAKVFEYLHTGKPILAISRPGELTEIVQKSGSGIVVSPDSVDGIVQTLKKLCTDHLNGQIVTSPDRAFIETYQRSVLTERLAAIFRDVNRVNADM